MIHIEQQWAENVHTVIGELMHKKVHDPISDRKKKRYTSLFGHFRFPRKNLESVENVIW